MGTNAGIQISTYDHTILRSIKHDINMYIGVYAYIYIYIYVYIYINGYACIWVIYI